MGRGILTISLVSIDTASDIVGLCTVGKLRGKTVKVWIENWTEMKKQTKK